MLTIKEAAQIGIKACIDKIGRDFVLANRENGTSAYGEGETADCVYCYVGVDDKPWLPGHTETLVLDSTSRFPYYASCNVRLEDGATTFIGYTLPA